MAQGPRAFGLQFGWDDDRRTVEPRGPVRALCLTDLQIREAISQRGYTNISLNAPSGDVIQVRAQLSGQLFLLQYNRCTDTIEGEQRLGQR